ncbi:MAG TPA: GNAT family N-acetyltransferase [Anaerolineales bacterium]|nr:GNAT family N-acetyltransferase [Anaerolineales bacterium]
MMTSTEIRMISPQEHQHLRAMAQLGADAFTEGKYVDQFCDNYIGNSHYDWNVSRVILDGDKMIHHWGVWGYPMRVESIQLQVGGIGAVVTHPDYRKQGWMHQAAYASFEAMQEAGYDLSILRGRHYVRLGYARAWNYVTYRLKPEELPETGPFKAYQPLQAEQVSAMDALYNQTHASFTGAAIRPTYLKRHPDDIGVYAWFGEQGDLEGYIRAFPAEEDPKTLTCLEAAGDPRQGLAVMEDLFKNGDYQSLAFFTLPHHHPVLQYLRKGACIVEDRYFDISGWRVKLINLQSSLQKLIPLFEQRLAQSQFAGWQGSLLLDSGEQKAVLHLDKGKLYIANKGRSANALHGGADIARFLLGSDEPDEIIRQANMQSSGLAAPLVKVLFPNLHPMMSHWDEY